MEDMKINLLVKTLDTQLFVLYDHNSVVQK